MTVDKATIELLKHTILEKHKGAKVQLNNAEGDRIEFHRGQMLAFNEVYTMLEQMSK